MKKTYVSKLFIWLDHKWYYNKAEGKETVDYREMAKLPSTCVGPFDNREEAIFSRLHYAISAGPRENWDKKTMSIITKNGYYLDPLTVKEIRKEYDSLKDITLSLMDCLAATCQSFPRGSSKYEKERHIDIAKTALESYRQGFLSSSVSRGSMTAEGYESRVLRRLESSCEELEKQWAAQKGKK
jgi:hypothetical protein